MINASFRKVGIMIFMGQLQEYKLKVHKEAWYNTWKLRWYDDAWMDSCAIVVCSTWMYCISHLSWKGNKNTKLTCEASPRLWISVTHPLDCREKMIMLPSCMHCQRSKFNPSHANFITEIVNFTKKTGTAKPA